MKNIFLLLIVSVILYTPLSILYGQDEEEQIKYYQMEPLDDSLFIQIQEELFIDPPDPKAEIIVDLREPNNQTITIKGTLYPFLALSPELRARIITYPFKINLEETINYGSIFTRVIDKIRLSKIVEPPTLSQISSNLGYINPFIQLFGGERFGIAIKKDVGLSFGFGTPYSGPLETNFAEANFHILGFSGGFFTAVDAMTQIKSSNNHNNLFVTEGIQLSYVIPFGNFFKLSYMDITRDFSQSQVIDYTLETVNEDNLVYNSDGTLRYQPYLVRGDFFNWEFRYFLKMLGSTRGKIYVASYMNEWHAGLSGREMSLAGSTFDFRFDAMFNSPVRQNQFVLDMMVQKIFDYWGFSSFAIGPAIILSKTSSGAFGVTSIFGNIRMKLGTSL